MARTNFLQLFMEFTENRPSPTIYRQWAAISLIAAIVEQKVYIETFRRLYPNLYILLIGPPGVGKSVMTSIVSQLFLAAQPRGKVSQPSTTRATLIEELGEAKRIIPNPSSKPLDYNALYVCVDELGVLLPAYDMDMMNKLTHIYDNMPYGERRRDKRHNIEIANPMINMLVGGTPGFLGEILPDVAWEQGFMSRMCMVYSDERTPRSLFSFHDDKLELKKQLISDLKEIAALIGGCLCDPEAAVLLEAFNSEAGESSAPMHPKLQNYNTRRPAQLIKLAIIASIMESNDLIITVDNVETAMAWMLSAEKTSPNIFTAMQTKSDTQVIKDIWYQVYTYNKSKNTLMPQASLYSFMLQRTPSDKIDWIIKTMISAKMLEKTSEGFRAVGQPKQ